MTDIGRSVLPPSLLTTSTIVGRPGAFLFYKQDDSLTIPVDFMIIEKTASALRAKVRSLGEILDTDEPKKLIFSDEPDKYINAIVSDGTELSEQLAVASGQINFYCPDPYWYAVNDDIITGTNRGVYNFVRKGNAESYPLIEIKGINGDGSRLIIISGGQVMDFRGDLLENETLYIDSDKMTAYIVDSNNVSRSVIQHLTNLDFIVLPKGDNSIDIRGTITSVKITCRSRWK